MNCPSSGRAGGRPSILIVDDDAVNRELFRWALEEIGDVTEMKNGKGVAAYVRDHAPNIVFLDLMMPVMDGYEVVDELSNLAPAMLRRVVLVTAAIAQSQILELKSSGVAGVHERPYDDEAIVSLFHTYVPPAG